MTSIFGGSKPTSNLFGSLGISTSAASQSQPGQTSNIFGSNNPSQPSSQQPLFPALGGQSNPPTSQSLFPNLGGQSNAPPQQPLLPTIGGQSNSQQPLFPNLSGQAKSNEAEQSAQSQQQNAASGSRTAYFDALLEQNKKRRRTAEERSAFGEVPSLELGLGDIAKRVRELGSGYGSQDQDISGVDSRA